MNDGPVTQATKIIQAIDALRSEPESKETRVRMLYLDGAIKMMARYRETLVGIDEHMDRLVDSVLAKKQVGHWHACGQCFGRWHHDSAECEEMTVMDCINNDHSQASR
jgi:hypothetical protein